ncbi:DUF354 domain-containing protein [Methanococcoides alaskense]|uniref:Glycosyltransferase n=1 Tax=Methanococcoides alaskense TaxID=325778 RepID=A0AA90TZN2_9EURY|nr:DUF354 domain-containing protein [Methanococcoides alaskense]MDA0524401.1 DUF354 domain-containing protein [Methanococcoides alaskense]MDR6223218.1 putative glycosyltransferase [Methanococcoides alaskense]
MRIMLDIGHPKDVNVFKNVILSLQEMGHTVKIFVRAKESTKRMLDDAGFEYEVCPYYKSMAGKAFGILANDLRLYMIARKFKPDVFVSPGSPYSAHVSSLMRKPHLAFSDTEIAGLVTMLTLPFTDKIYTSTSFYLDLGPKQERFKGYYELAYLHPKYFKPNKSVLDKYGLEEGYILLRLSALSSHHDLHASGFDFETEDELRDYISSLEKYGRVIISSEKLDWDTIKEYQLDLDPDDLHDIINYASICLSEGATMASEAAVLGIPSIYVSNTERGYLNELETEYDLVYNIPDRGEALEKTISFLQNKNTKDEWQSKKVVMLNHNIDVCNFIIDRIINIDKRGL